LPASNTTVQLLTLYTPTPGATMHSVTDGQTDRRTDDIMMPTADPTIHAQYDWLKTIYSYDIVHLHDSRDYRPLRFC